jgi:hypothetical protein
MLILNQVSFCVLSTVIWIVSGQSEGLIDNEDNVDFDVGGEDGFGDRFDEEGGPLDKKSTYSGNLSLPEGYNRLTIPISEFQSHVYIYVSLFVRSLLDVDEINEVINYFINSFELEH